MHLNVIIFLSLSNTMELRLAHAKDTMQYVKIYIIRTKAISENQLDQ